MTSATLLRCLQRCVIVWLVVASLTSPGARAEPAPDPSSPATIRSTEFGLVQGTSGDVLTFLGIPYAAAPVGPLRWQAPASAPKWDGVRQATRFGPDCYGQASMRTGSLAPAMSEDCLYANIWSPNDGESRHPVMVWVYGGSFLGGSAAMPFYDGAALARHGVVVVTFNYRTNIFGFFAHPELSREGAHGTSGNYGLMDILAALRWVGANIDQFGGDPDRITAFGESAGASALGLLMTSPRSEGVFQQAILESPGLGRPLASLSESAHAGQQLEQHISQLRAMDAPALMALAQVNLARVRRLEQPRPIGPIVDGWVLPTTDRDALAQGRVDHVPVIIGSNAQEGRLFTKAMPVHTVAQYQNYLSSQFGDRAAQLARCYPARTDAEVASALARLYGDHEFVAGVDAFSAALVSRNIPVWRYQFSGDIEAGRSPASHGGEVPFVFGLDNADTDLFEKLGFDSLTGGASPADRALSTQMMSAWTSFASRADPNEPGTDTWPMYRQDGAVLHFGPPVDTDAGCMESHAG